MFIETICQFLDALFQFLPSGGVNGCKSHFVVVLFALLLLSDAKVSRLFHYSSKRRDSGIYEEILGDCWLLQRSHSEERLLYTLWLSILYSIASLVQVITSIHRSKATRPIANDTLFVSAICTLIEPLFFHLDCEKGLFVVSCQRKAMHSEARKPSLCFLRKNSSNLALALEKELIIKTM